METSALHLEDLQMLDMLRLEPSCWIFATGHDILMDGRQGQVPLAELCEDLENSSLVVTMAVGEQDGSQGDSVCGRKDVVEEILHILRGGDVFACHEE
jgi:hypothetical protein